MNACPHYKEYTLWWVGEEGSQLTCPPDFVRNCQDMECECFDDCLQDEYEMNETEMHLEELHLEDHEAFLNEVKDGIEEYLLMMYIEDKFLDSINAA